MSDLDIFIGWHCTGAFKHRKPTCGEPCVWCRNHASNDIASLRASGYVVVPSEPTDDMIMEGWQWVDTSDIYRAMIAQATRKEDGE